MSIQISDFIVTLKKFHDQQRLADGKETISIRVLEEYCESKKLPGARKVGGRWFVNLLEWMNSPEVLGAEESNTPSKDTRNGGSREGQNPGRPAVPSSQEEEGIPARIRFTS